MAVLDDISMPNGTRTPGAIQAIAAQFWAWYELNKHDVILRRGVWIFSIDITVEDLEPVFVRLFGVRPEA